MNINRMFLLSFLCLLLFVACNKGDDEVDSDPVVTELSPSRFKLIKGDIYKISDHQIDVFKKLTDTVVKQAEIKIEERVLTIQESGDKLLIKTTDGTLIYDISNPLSPKWLATSYEIKSCSYHLTDSLITYVANSDFTESCGEGTYVQVLQSDDLTSGISKAYFYFPGIKHIAKTHDFLITTLDNEIQLFETTSVDSLELAHTFYPDQVKCVLADSARFIGVTESSLHLYEISSGGVVEKLVVN